MKLKIGRISYANLFPIFFALERQHASSSYDFVEGVPSVLNRMMREGGIDICCSSSIEYLRNGGRYSLIDGHSISSKGPIRSLYLFSRRPIEALGGATVLTSSQSEATVAFLKIILGKFYGLQCSFMPSSESLEEALKTSESYLLIGDDAIAEYGRWPELYIYDIGELWYRQTGLPAIFALWIVRRGCCMEAPWLLERFTEDLRSAKEYALANLSAAASAFPRKDLLTEGDLVGYWKGISYDLTEEHKRGLELFRNYAKELGLV